MGGHVSDIVNLQDQENIVHDDTIQPLPYTVVEPILEGFKRIGGHHALGLALSKAIDTQNGIKVQYFECGVVYWSATTGAHTLTPEFLARYIALGLEKGAFGLPVADPVSIPGGRQIQLQRGMFYWSQISDTHALSGSILERYLHLGGPQGWLGFPTSDVSEVRNANGQATGGWLCRFTNGTLYWQGQGVPCEVHGGIRELYEAIGGPLGPAGYPTSDETAYPGTDVRYNTFERGIIVWKPGVGARFIPGLVLHIGGVNVGEIDDGVEFLGKDRTAELITYTTVKVDGKVLANREQSPEGHAGTSYDINRDFKIALAPGTRIYLRIDVEDWDAASANDDLGSYEKTFDIGTFWGLLGGQPAGIYAEVDATRRGGDLKGHLRFTYSVAVDQPLNPALAFREQYWWRSNNFTTAVLTREQYGETFSDIHRVASTWDKITHPFETAYFEIFRGIAAKGNCFGMCLEAIDARCGHSIFREPLYQHQMNAADTSNNEETNIYNSMRRVINTKHAYQLGADAIRWIAGRFISGIDIAPLLVYQRVKYFLGRGDYPILSMFDLIERSGHAVLPYAYQDGDGSTANPHRIYVADPNVVWRERTRVDPMGRRRPLPNPTYVEIYADNTFRYVGGTSEYKSNGIIPGLLPSTMLLEIPYHRLSSKPCTPCAEVLFGLHALLGGLILLTGDAESAQIMSDAKPFYQIKGDKRVGLIEKGTQGLSLIPLLDVDGKIFELYAQLGPLPQNLVQTVRGTGQGSYTYTVAGPGSIVSLQSPIASDAKDTLRLEELPRRRPMLSFETTQAQKAATIDISLLPELGRALRRTYQLSLPVSKVGPARMGVGGDGSSLVIAPVGEPQSLNVVLQTVEDNQVREIQVMVMPQRGAVLELQPGDWSKPQGDIVVDHRQVIDGEVLNREILRGRVIR
jgi:hypothetical protein